MVSIKQTGAPLEGKVHLTETKKGPKGPSFLPHRNISIRANLERETRLASGLQAVDIKGLSVVPEMGIALILDSFSEAFKV